MREKKVTLFFVDFWHLSVVCSRNFLQLCDGGAEEGTQQALAVSMRLKDPQQHPTPLPQVVWTELSEALTEVLLGFFTRDSDTNFGFIKIMAGQQFHCHINLLEH